MAVAGLDLFASKKTTCHCSAWTTNIGQEAIPSRPVYVNGKICFGRIKSGELNRDD